MRISVNRRATVFGAFVLAALGYAAVGIASPVTVSAQSCYVCCENDGQCGSFPDAFCHDFGINCQDMACKNGAGEKFCAIAAEN